jgi:hypothetical protein
MLADLAPVGAVETMLTERVISLWWRLKHAERMQNEVIEDMIVLFVTNRTSRSCCEYHLADHGLHPDDPGYDLDGLALGRIASSDFANSRALDRMLMYERRIESSVIRLTKELRKQQLMCRIEQREIGQDQAIAQTEALMGRKVNLKKQSQFMPGLMGVTPFIKEAYGKNMPAGDDENKANITVNSS